MSKENLDFSVSKEWQNFAEENPWISFVFEIARDSNGIEYYRKAGSNIVYKKIDRNLKCIDCDSDVFSGEVAHSIHNGPFPLSGSGKCHYEEVPYCPRCEEKPKFYGLPIKIDYLFL